MLSPEKKETRGRKKKGEKQRDAIADLPSGIGVYRASNGNGDKYWRVRLGKRWTGGEVVLRDFPDLTGVRSYVDQQREQRGDTGRKTYTLTLSQMAEATDAFNRLDGTGLTMTKAITFALARHRRPEDALSWETAQKLWLAAPRKRPLDPRTIQAYSISLQFLAVDMKAEKLLPHQVVKKEIEDFLLDDEREWEPATIGHHLRNLSSFFGWLLREKHCIENPTKGIIEPDVLGETTILSPDQAETLLTVASGPMRLCVGLGMFGGLRTSEIRRLVWSEIGTRKIEIKAKKTKTRQSRMVPILPPLRVLIDAYDGPRAGLVAPDRWKKEFEALVGAAGWRGPDGESTWPTNAMRHSYGSYRLDEIQDENQVAAEMGNSPEMIFKHYRKVIQDGETPKFWAIRHFK